MRVVQVCVISAILLILPEYSHQLECGKGLGKGAVMCSLGIQGDAGNFDYSLCTHASIVVHVKCENQTCYPVSDSEFETMYRWVQPYNTTKLGLFVTFDNFFKDFLIERLRRLNTAKAFLKFMTDKNLTFIEFDQPTQHNDFNVEADRNALFFIQELAGAMHSRDWYIGLKVNVRTEDFKPAYNFEALSEYVDWFSFSTRKSIIAGYEMWPLAPLTSTYRDHVGTTKYWIEKALEKLDPQCIVFIVDVFGVKYIAEENDAEPGPGSLARLDIKSVFLVQLCYKLYLDPSCQEHWDEESNTPWAACGNEFYSFENQRSVKAKTELAKKYNLAGMSIYLDRKNICADRNPILLVNALQGIRHTSSKKGH